MSCSQLSRSRGSESESGSQYAHSACALPLLVAHGFQVLIQTCPGSTTLVHQVDEAIIAFTEQSSRFLAPVYANDTVYPALTITDLKAQRTTGVMTLRATVHNHNSELVMTGEHKLLIRRRPVETGS